MHELDRDVVPLLLHLMDATAATQTAIEIIRNEVKGDRKIAYMDLRLAAERARIATDRITSIYWGIGKAGEPPTIPPLEQDWAG